MDDILYIKEFKNLEFVWCGLKMLVDCIDFIQNIKIEMINVFKQDLYDDFEDVLDIIKFGLYKLVYIVEYGQFGGELVGVIIVNYDFGFNLVDMKIMQSVVVVFVVFYVFFIVVVGLKFFGLDQFDGLFNLKELSFIFEGLQFVKWCSFCEFEDVKYVGFILLCFLL